LRNAGFISHGSRTTRAQALRSPRPQRNTVARLLNADEFAAEVGLTARTVRSYHARGLLPPPVRLRRRPYYLPDHLTRMRHVLWLQSRGLSLDAVRALLEPDSVLGRLVPVGHAVAEAVRGRPALLAVMVDSGILRRRRDGALEVRAVRAVLAAGARDTTVLAALNLLAEVAVGVGPQADAVLEVAREVTARIPLGTNLDTDEVVELAVELVRARIMRKIRQEDAPVTVPE
jgi:DNA-binding transcriptional MerR regulator